MTKVYIDIETIPTQDEGLQAYIASTVKPPGNMKKQDTIDKWIAEEKPDAVAEALLNASFDGATNHIVTIGLAFDEEPAASFHIEKVEDEKDMIAFFWQTMSDRLKNTAGHTFIGHNIIGFDLKVLRKRSMILRTRPPSMIPFEGKPWEKNPYDTMLQWDAKEFAKLDKIAKAFNIEGKAFDGSQVYKLWLDKQFALLNAYCKDDVELTRKVYKRMEFID